MTTDLAVVILAAGHGTRMNSKRQKLLHEVGGKPMIQHVFDTAVSTAQYPPVFVTGKGGDKLRDWFQEQAFYVKQTEKLGTGHATRMATDLLQGQSKQVAVLYGDMPLLKANTLAELAAKQAETGAAVIMLSVMGKPESAFGRVVRNAYGHVREIVEVAEARRRSNTTALLNIQEHNAGVYCFDAAFLWENLPHLPQHIARDGNIEYYLTDMIGLAVAQGRMVEAMTTDDADECLGAGTRAEMVPVEQAFRHRAVRYHQENGVTIMSPDSTFIDQGVEIGQDTVLWPNTFIQGKTMIGEDCVIGPNTIIRKATLGRGCRVEQAVVENVTLEDGKIVTPFTHLSDPYEA